MSIEDVTPSEIFANAMHKIALAMTLLSNRQHTPHSYNTMDESTSASRRIRLCRLGFLCRGIHAAP